jgi:hypothetical protein
MKTKLIILFVLVSSFLFSQKPFNDAIILAEYWDNDIMGINITENNASILLPILGEYLKENTKLEIKKLQNDIKQLEDSLQTTDSDKRNQLEEGIKNTRTNIYTIIKRDFSEVPKFFFDLPTKLQSPAILDFTSFNKEIFNSIGGVNVTNVADGLAKFLVERTKEELSINFFNKFYEVLKHNDEYSSLFPTTFKALKTVGVEVYQFSSYINTLREAFKKDLENILNGLDSFISAKKKSLYASNINDPLAQKLEYFESAFLIVNNLRQGVHPANAIGKLEFLTYHPNNKPLQNIREVVKLFNIFSNSLRSSNPNQYWVSSQSLNKLLNPNAFKIYLGLIYKLNGKQIIFNKPLSDYLDDAATDVEKIESYKKYVTKLVLDTENIVLAIDNIKQKKENNEKITSYKNLFDSTLGFLENFKEVENLNLGIDLNQTKEVWEVLEIVNNIYLNTNEANYNALILDVSKLMTVLLGTGNFTWDKELLKYGTFIANVAKAENSDEVKAAIEAIALPVGSASIKKRTKSNISLNAYLGLSPGLERNGDLDEFKFTFGVSAPVGIAFNWGHGKYLNKKCNCEKEGGSSSLFLSVIDLGAVTNYRFEDSDTEELPEIKLKNIFAPGTYYVYGFPKAPVSIGAGAQLGPQLRQITSDQMLNLDSKISLSFKVFIAVDIPLLNFYTKSR